jgi:plastocyanin
LIPVRRPANCVTGPAVAVLILGALSGCGGADGPPSSAAEQPEIPERGVYGQAPIAANGVRSVITMTPADGGSASADRGEPLIDQFGLSFSPQRLVVDAGATLRVTNSEASLSHNVQLRSVATDAILLNEDALPGDVLELVLPDAGGYDVTCDVHPGMTAFVFVTSAPWATFAEEDGSFALGVVPVGDYMMQLWTVDTGYGPETRITVGEAAQGVDLRPAG